MRGQRPQPRPEGATRSRPVVAQIMRRQEPRLWSVGSVVVVLLTWEGLVRGGLVTTRFLPPPSHILAATWHLYVSGEMLEHLGASAASFAVGLGAAILLGVPIGLTVGWSPRLDALLAPYLAALYATPKLALLPILIIWIGIGLGSVAAVVFLAALFPIVLNLATGVRATDVLLLRVARSFEAGDLRILWTIIMPSTVPFFLVGLRPGVIGSLVSIVVGEMYASRAGIGYLVAVMGATLQITKMFGAVLVLTVSGLVAILAIDWLQKRVEAWRPARAS